MLRRSSFIESAWFALCFIIFLANTIGAVSGMVGVVIIKPLLDVIGLHSVAAISFYSAIEVFAMAVVSTSRQMKQGIQLSFSTVPLIL